MLATSYTRVLKIKESCTPLILAVWRWKQEDYKLEARLDYIVRHCPGKKGGREEKTKTGD
jgi:hypothetical protein